MQNSKLKLGILLDSFEVPAWVYTAIQQVVDGGSGQFELVILNADDESPEHTCKDPWLYSIFDQVDRRLFTKEPDPFASKDARELLGQVPVLKVQPVSVENSGFLKGTDIRSIREYQLDIAVRFGFENLRCETVHLAKYGTWSYCHSDDRKTRGGPPGFWEVAEGWPETGSALLATGGDLFPRRVLYRSHYFTYPVSPARHRSCYFWATTPFLQRQIEFLRRHGEEQFLKKTEKFNAQPPSKAPNPAPLSNLSAVRPIGRILRRLGKETLDRSFYEDQWSLMFSLREDGRDGFAAFERLMPPKGKFWADPHVVQANGRYHIFIEEFVHSRNKGHIAVIEMDESGAWKPPVKILEEDYHLSYPFVFNWDGKYYMIPESGARRSIDLYECLEFPYAWKFKHSLMKDVLAVDTTLFGGGSKWWLFTTIAENAAAAPNFELFLFYADHPLAEHWTPHPQNPIVSDVKSARPAGDVLVKDGKLVRPSQDCSVMYGHGFDLNEIELLSETEYCERTALSVRPGWDPEILGTHTYANRGSLTVIDVFRRRRKL